MKCRNSSFVGQSRRSGGTRAMILSRSSNLSFILSLMRPARG